MSRRDELGPGALEALRALREMAEHIQRAFELMGEEALAQDKKDVMVAAYRLAGKMQAIGVIVQGEQDVYRVAEMLHEARG